MKETPLRVLHKSVTKEWDIEKLVNYEATIISAIMAMEEMGKPLTIEYIAENQNVVDTLKMKGNKKKLYEYLKKLANQFNENKLHIAEEKK